MGCRDGREACFHAPYARPLSTVHQMFPSGFILRFPSPLQSSFALTSARSFRSEPTARVLFPLHDITQASPHTRRFPKHPLGSVHRRSQPPDGLLLARASRFISPSSHVQRWFGVQGLLSPRSSAPSSGVVAPMPLPSERSSGSHDPPSTLGRLGFEALLHAEQRSHRLGVEPDR